MTFALIFGILGLIIGSFLNVLIIRAGARSIGGRSACMSCGKQLAWFDMIPVGSWVYLRGRCRFCKSKISIQYPLVEATTAFLFALIGAQIHPLIGGDLALLLTSLLTVTSLSIAAILVAIAVYDLRHTIIPDRWAYLFAGLAFVSNFLIIGFFDTSPLLFVLAGPVTALPLFLLWLVSGGRWMGLGDAKLSLGIGWLLGIPYGLYAVLFSFIIGAFFSVAFLLPLPYYRAILGITPLGHSRTGFTMKSEIAFGPFLIASTFLFWILMMYGITIPFIP